MKASRTVKWISAAVICLTVLSFYIRYGFVSFETNDDEAMNLIAAGAYGPQREYLMFMHILIGHFIKLMYTLMPERGCYALFFLFLNVCSVITICGILSEKKSIPEALLLILLVNIMLSGDYYRVLQFTKNASLYAAAGFLLIAESEFQNRKYIAAGIFFLTVSFMTRDKQFVFMVPFAVLHWLWKFMTMDKNNRPVLLRSMVKTAFSCGVVIFLIFSVNEYAYRSPEWKDYWKYESAVSELLDFGMPRYAEHQKEYTEIGWSETDVRVFLMWDYPDQENIYALEKLDSIAAMKTSGISIEYLTECLVRIVERPLRYIANRKMIVIFSVLVMAAGMATGKKQRNYLPLLMTAGVFAECLFLLCIHRINWRVEAGVWLIPCLYILYEFRDAALNNRLWNNLLLCAGILFSMLYHYQSYVGMQTDRYNWGNNYEQFFRTIALEYTDQFIYGESMTFVNRKLIADPLKCDRSYEDYYKNFSMMGGWEIPSPVGLFSQRAFGIDNAAQAMAHNENVLFAAEESRAEIIMNYLREYNDDTEFVKINEIDGIQIWSMVAEKH